MIEFLIFGTLVLIAALAVTAILEQRKITQNLDRLDKTIVDRTKPAPIKEEAVWGPGVTRQMYDQREPKVKFKDEAEEAQLYHKKTYQ